MRLLSTGGRYCLGFGIAALLLACGNAERQQPLTIAVRCDPGVSGSLLVELEDGTQGQQMDLQMLCRQGTMQLAEYQRGQPIRFRWSEGAVEKATLTSEFPEHIQSQVNDGYYLVIAVRAQPPLLSNERL